MERSKRKTRVIPVFNIEQKNIVPKRGYIFI